MGTNRAAIAKADLTGLPVGTPQTLDNHIFVNSQAGYQNNSGDVGKYSPDAANKALDDAGWAKGSDGIRAKGGQQLKVRVHDPGRRGLQQERGRADAVDDAGDRRQARHHDGAVERLLRQVRHPRNFDITPFSWIGTPFPGGGSKDIYVCKKGSSGGSNFTATCDPTIDQDFADALSSLDINTYRPSSTTRTCTSGTRCTR